ncbi:MAG TPA: YtxH domain-containing protein [Acidisarcina sp.]
MSEDNGSGGFSWFLAGLGLGALVGVLYAPKSGRETREELAYSAREGTEYLKQRSREAADQVSGAVERGKGQVTDYVNQGVAQSKQVVEKSRAQWEDFVSQGRQIVNEQTEKVSAAVDAGKQAYQTTTVPPVVPAAPEHGA